jgi:large subunit ribosomal protein L17
MDLCLPWKINQKENDEAMRHGKSGVKLNRTSSHRKALFRNLVTALFKYDRIRTTDAKAKEIRRWADELITLAKRGDLHARRQALEILTEKDVVYKLFTQVSDRYGAISGGYTRIVKLGNRPGDAAPISLIELVGLDKVGAFVFRKKPKAAFHGKRNKLERGNRTEKDSKATQDAQVNPSENSVE